MFVFFFVKNFRFLLFIQILVVIEPLLIDEDYYARVEGREIISNLAKAAGLATMISTMRPDIDNIDEYVRNTTARAFAVVASALGIPSLLPFLKAVCRSKKSWQARHTGKKKKKPKQLFRITEAEFSIGVRSNLLPILLLSSSLQATLRTRSESPYLSLLKSTLRLLDSSLKSTDPTYWIHFHPHSRMSYSYPR